jgi:hypothetical protein
VRVEDRSAKHEAAHGPADSPEQRFRGSTAPPCPPPAGQGAA